MTINYAPAMPQKRSVAIASFAALALGLTAGCASHKGNVDNSAPDTTVSAAPVHVAGTVSLLGRYVDFTSRGGSDCTGKGGFSDLTPGAQVRITDATGQTLTVTRLGNGITDADTTEPLADGVCIFTFNASVPGGKGSYTIKVANHGNQTFTEQQMATPKLFLG